MNSKLRVQLPHEKVEQLKEKYGLTDDSLQDVLQSVEVEPGPNTSLIAGETKEEDDPFMASLTSLAKRGGGDMGEVMAYSLLIDAQERREDRREERRWRNEDRQKAKGNRSNPETDAVKGEISDLKKTVNDLVETLKEKEQEKAQQEFAEGVVTNVTSQILPELTKLETRLTNIEERAQTQPNVDIGKEMKEAIEELGEKLATKVSVGKITVDDFEPILSFIERLEKRFKKGDSEGELDWRNVAVNTLGEVGKEVVGAFRDIEKTKAGRTTFEQGAEESQPAPPMRGIIKRQLQNYILAKLQGGATSLNIPEAAQKLGLTQQQVFKAYQDLVKEGWFQTVMEGGGQPGTGEEAAIPTQEKAPGEIFKRTEAVFTA